MTTTDRELLERAAKAYWGDEVDDVMPFYWDENEGAIVYTHADNQDHNGNDVELLWNPLHDDGDEARLEGALLMNVSWGMASVTVDSCTERFSDHGGDKQKARRYAGVRAAAAMAGEGE